MKNTQNKKELNWNGLTDDEQTFIERMIKLLKKNRIRVSLFIEPNINDIKLSQALGSNCVELHTGNYCNLLNFA